MKTEELSLIIIGGPHDGQKLIVEMYPEQVCDQKSDEALIGNCQYRVIKREDDNKTMTLQFVGFSN